MKNTNNKPKAIIFDNEQVLVDSDWERVARAAQSIGYPALKPEELVVSFRLYTDAPDNPLYQYARGELSATDFWSRVLKHHKMQPTPKNIKAMQAALEMLITDVDPDALDVAQKLKAEGYRVFILSNTNPDILRGNRERYNYMDFFDGSYFSCEIGHRKPEPNAYQRILQDHGLSPEDCLFIDDQERNLTAAAALGIRTLQHKIGDAVPLSKKLAYLLESSPAK